MPLPKGAAVCPRCESAVARREPKDPKRQPTVTVVLRLVDATNFVLTGKQEYVIGRRDAKNAEHQPDIDLTAWNNKRAVSRRQAKIILTPEGAFIEDLGGVNKTVRNNFRLFPGQRYPIQDGDILQFGELSIWVAIRPDSGAIKP